MKKQTEQQLKDIATEAGKTIVIRTWDNGNSVDTRRKATKKESTIISNLVYAGIWAINAGYDASSAAITAEIGGHVQLPDGTNNYDTIYCPIRQFGYDIDR